MSYPPSKGIYRDKFVLRTPVRRHAPCRQTTSGIGPVFNHSKSPWVTISVCLSLVGHISFRRGWWSYAGQPQMIKWCIPTTMPNGVGFKVQRLAITSTLISEATMWPKFDGGLQSLQKGAAGRQLLLGMVNSTIRHGNVIWTAVYSDCGILHIYHPRPPSSSHHLQQTPMNTFVTLPSFMMLSIN